MKIVPTMIDRPVIAILEKPELLDFLLNEKEDPHIVMAIKMKMFPKRVPLFSERPIIKTTPKIPINTENNRLWVSVSFRTIVAKIIVDNGVKETMIDAVAAFVFAKPK